MHFSHDGCYLRVSRNEPRWREINLIICGAEVYELRFRRLKIAPDFVNIPLAMFFIALFVKECASSFNL